MRDTHAMKFARLCLALSACFCIGVISSCGEEVQEVPAATEISVLVSVEGLTPAVSSLYVSTTLNGVPAQQGTEITGRLDKFAIYLPLETSGTLGISVVARSTERCLTLGVPMVAVIAGEGEDASAAAAPAPAPALAPRARRPPPAAPSSPSAASWPA